MPISRVFKGRLRKSSLRGLLSLAIILTFFWPWPGIFYALQVVHLQDQRTVLTFPFLRDQTFGISLINSLFRAPVLEMFEVRGKTIYLKGITTHSWEVIEYYNLSGAISQNRSEIKIQDINFKVPRLTFMIGFIGQQHLIWKNQEYPLYNLTAAGGVLLIEAESLSPARYLWQRMIQPIFPKNPLKAGEKI